MTDTTHHAAHRAVTLPLEVRATPPAVLDPAAQALAEAVLPDAYHRHRSGC